MKKSPFFSLLFGLLFMASSQAQTIPILNGGFETTICSFTCNYQSQSAYIYNGCLRANAAVEGWYCGSLVPIYQRNDCNPDYNAYDGHYCVEIGGTSGADGPQSTIFYQFTGNPITANSAFSWGFNYIPLYENASSNFYLYIVGSNTLVNNNGGLNLEDVLEDGGTILSKHMVSEAEFNWNTVNTFLTNTTNTNYSQILIYPSKSDNLDFQQNTPIQRGSAGPDIIIGIDSVQSITLLGDYCCLIPVLTFKCLSLGSLQSAPPRKVCASVGLFSPCEEAFLDESLYELLFIGQFGPDSEDFYCSSTPQEVIATIELIPEMLCFEESEFSYVLGNYADLEFQLPDTSFCQECSDLDVSFTKTTTIVDCTPGYPPYQMNPDALEYSFINTTTYGDETPTLFYWEFTLSTGIVITSSLENPKFYIAKSLNATRDCANFLQSQSIPAPIVHAELTVYTENGCYQTYANAISPLTETPNEKMALERRTFQTLDGDIRLTPNPATDFLQLSMNTSAETVFSLKIYTLQGSLVRDIGVINLPKGEVSERIDISDLSSGTYFLDIRNYSSSTTIPFTRIK